MTDNANDARLAEPLTVTLTRGDLIDLADVIDFEIDNLADDMHDADETNDCRPYYLRLIAIRDMFMEIAK